MGLSVGTVFLEYLAICIRILNTHILCPFPLQGICLSKIFEHTDKCAKMLCVALFVTQKNQKKLNIHSVGEG